MGPPTLRNKDLARQTYAIKSYARQLKQVIMRHNNDSVESPQQRLDVLTQNQFYMKEINNISCDVYAKLLSDKQAGNRVYEYMNTYSSDPNYIEMVESGEQQIKDKMRDEIKMDKQERNEMQNKTNQLMRMQVI